MLIGEFNDSFPPITDGVAAVVKNYAHWITLKSAPVDRCIVVTPDVPGHTDSDEIFEVLRYASLPFLLRKPYRVGIQYLDAQFLMRLEETPFDIVHAHTPFNSGTIASTYARRHNIPLVASFHTKYRDDFLPFVRSEAIADAMIREVVRFYERAESVWTVSHSAVDALREYGYKGPVTVLLNGTDLDPADPACRRSEASRSVCEALGIREDIPVFLYVGQHVWQKNLRMLVEALALVKSRLVEKGRNSGKEGDPCFRMIFVGGGEAEKDLEDLVETLGLANETRFLGVLRDRDLLRGLFERSDLFLFPSTYDTSALVRIEAASALCPSVFVEGSTVSEGVVDGVNGFLAKETPQDFAMRILDALEDPEVLIRAGLAAQRDFHRPWSSVAMEALEQYREILARYQARQVRKGSRSSTPGRQRKRSRSIVPSSATSTPSESSKAD